MLAVPKDVSWSFIRYDDPNVRLFNTDLDYINGEPEPSDTPGNEQDKISNLDDRLNILSVLL